MKRENYQKVIEVFQSAVQLSPEKREAFLQKECGENVELRRKVEILLDKESSRNMEDLKATQVPEGIVGDEMEAEQAEKSEPSNQNNRQFGSYRIIRKIGVGGMGEVYLAHDTNLDRKVALKLLPPKFTNDPQHLQRFKQEARSASALNHPYILTIFEFGETADGVHFIASEFVEGQTLDKFCANDEPDLSYKLDILIRIASGLSAAHEAGIIHRDIKPENIIVRPDGYIKVLDFGLAKLIEGYQKPGEDLEASTLPLVRTNPGIIMGTVSYMSPEQAKGKDLDARSDIFSFGVVIYEVITGHLPFKGDSAMETIAAILHKEPKPVDEREIPHEIKRIIEKTLKKDRSERYQTLKDLLLDLKEIRRELEFQHKLERSLQPESEKTKTQIAKAEATAEALPGNETQNKTRRMPGSQLVYLQVALVTMLVITAGVSLWWFVFGRSEQTAATDPVLPGSLKRSEITNWANSAGEVSSAASFSADGKFIAFGSTAAGTTGIWVKQTNTGDAIQVTKDEFYNRYPVWSPSGEEIVYYSKRGDSYGLWRVSLMGGEQKLVTDKIDNESKPRLWSKSGKIYFQGAYNLFAADAETGEVAQITDFPSSGTPVKIIKITPDESKFAFLTTENNSWKINVKPVGGSQITQIIDSKKPIDNVIWHPDGKRLLFSQKTEEFYQIFMTDLSGSEPVPLSFGDGDNSVQDISSDGARILFSSVTETSDLWRIDKETAKESLAASQIDAELWADVSPDSSMIVYQSIKNLRQGSNLLNSSIVMQPISKDGRPLKLAENGFSPQWSPDGKTVAFLKLAGQKPEIWRVSDTGDSLKLISADGVQSLDYWISPYLKSQVKHLSWSPRNSVLAFPATKGGFSNIWMVSADGSNERKLSANEDGNQYLYCPIWDSDGNTIAFSSQMKKRDAEGKRKYFIWFCDIETNNQQKVLETEETVRFLGWAENEDELIFAVKKEDKEFTLTPPETPIRSVSLKTGEQRNLTVLKDAYFNNIHLSPDRKSIAFTSRSSGNDDVWVSRLAGDEPHKLTQNNDPRLYFSSLAWSPDGKTIFFGKQTRFTHLSMLINPKIMEKKNEKSNQ